MNEKIQFRIIFLFRTGTQGASSIGHIRKTIRFSGAFQLMGDFSDSGHILLFEGSEKKINLFANIQEIPLFEPRSLFRTEHFLEVVTQCGCPIWEVTERIQFPNRYLPAIHFTPWGKGCARQTWLVFSMQNWDRPRRKNMNLELEHHRLSEHGGRTKAKPERLDHTEWAVRRESRRPSLPNGKELDML